MRYHIDFQDPGVNSELIKTMVAKTPVAYIILDRNFQVHFINEYFLKLRRLRREDVLGKFCYSLSNNATDIDVRPHWSVDLVTWSADGVSVEPVSDDGQTTIFEARVPVGENPAMSMRLNVTRP